MKKRKYPERFVPITLREGDRVHYPGDPSDRGTIAIPSEHRDARGSYLGVFLVLWDRGQRASVDSPHTVLDVDECDQYGRLTTVGFDGEGRPRQVVLTHRLRDLEAARRRSDAAYARFNRSLERDDRRHGRAAPR